MRIYLTGFMGSGKSTVGKILAEKLGSPFIDLDQELEYKTNQSITSIFEQQGETSFRDLEKSTLELFLMDPFVMATGGGTFIHNRDWMLNHGTVVYLDVPFEKLVTRVGADPKRPLWSNARKLYDERIEHYSQAHHLVDGTEDPEKIADKIKNLIFQVS
jgi:shikimate kinase